MEQSLVNFLKDYVEVLKEKYNESLMGGVGESEADRNFRLGSNLAYYDCLDVLEQQLVNFGYDLTQLGRISPDIGSRIE